MTRHLEALQKQYKANIQPYDRTEENAEEKNGK